MCTYMKFLKNVHDGMNVMPLNFLYHNERNYELDDAIDIIYKDMDSGEVIVETIEKPEIEVWVVKPEYRKYINTPRDYLKMEILEPHRVRYRNRYAQIGKILGLDKEAVRACPWVLQSNIDIRTFYAVQFALEYSNERPKKLNVGLFDIESDTINIDHFPRKGECPTNLISFVDAVGKIAWLFILEPSGPARAINPNTGRAYDNRDQIQDLKNHQEDFIRECHAMFDERYGSDMEYQLLFFDDEMKMTKTFFELLEMSGIDYAMAWNMPYDMGNLLGRPEALCYDPTEICCSNKFKYKDATFVEDENPVAHKRKHICQFSHPTTFIDMLVLYAGIRSARGKPESLKLQAVAQKELKDEKLDYSEAGNIRTAAYEDFRKFALYSLKDSLLLYALHLKTNDIADLYQRCYTNGLLPNEVFTTTILLTDAITVDYFKEGLVVGNNRNKYRPKDINNFNATQEDDELSDEDEDIEIGPEDDDEEEEENSSKNKKKKNFEGALVQNPNRQLSSGFKINGVENAKIHEHLIDEDVTSLYPSLMIIMNLSNDTMIGRITIPYDMEDYFVVHKKSKKYEFFNHKVVGDLGTQMKASEEYKYGRFSLDGYDFIDEDRARYKINVSDMFAMMVAGEQWSELGTNFFNLTSFSETEALLLDMCPEALRK